MFSTAFKSLVSKPVLANTAFKSALFNSKTPFQAALLQRGFARNFQRGPNPEATNTGPVHQEKPPIVEQHIATGPTVDKLIKEDMNLNKFMTKIYKTTGLSIASSLTLSYLLATSTMAIAASPFVTMFGGLALSIGGIIALGKIPPEIVLEKLPNGTTVEKWVNPTNRKLAFSAIIGGSGIMLSPLIQGLLFVNPGIIPVAAGLSIMTMGGASLYAMNKPLGQFKAWESTLTAGLFGLIGMNLTSLLLTAMIGPNIFSFACGRIDMYVGLALFTMFQAFDTQVAVQAYKDGNYDHLMHVVNFFLNFKNMFIRIAQIMSMWRDD